MVAQRVRQPGSPQIDKNSTLKDQSHRADERVIRFGSAPFVTGKTKRHIQIPVFAPKSAM